MQKELSPAAPPNTFLRYSSSVARQMAMGTTIPQLRSEARDFYFGSELGGTILFTRKYTTRFP